MKAGHASSNTQTLMVLPVMLLIGLFLGASGPPAFAQETDCNSPQTQLAMNICAGKDFEAADATLNTEYAKAREYMKSIDGNLSSENKGAAKALLDAQRAWITYRDLACTAEGYVVKGGSMEPMVFSECKTRLTQQRIEDLRQLIAWN